MPSNLAGSLFQPSRQLVGPSAQLNLFSFITPIDLNRLVGALVLNSAERPNMQLLVREMSGCGPCADRPFLWLTTR